VIPYSRIDTVFLDVGNTLISVDFDWIASELATRQLACPAEVLRRAEAAARPAYAKWIFVDRLPAGADLFRIYLSAMLGCADATRNLGAPAFEELVTELRAALRPDGRASVLWRSVMPRVPEALARLKRRGVTLVVVSNSDGTVERSLEVAGLRPYFDTVIDSALVGFEKPDRRIFDCAIERSGADRERTLHVGDLYHADILGARAAGIHALMLDPFGDWSLDDCDCVPDLWAVADLLDGNAAR
jgi:HAD superfamily hydrolase (TIGR01509 family)